MSTDPVTAQEPMSTPDSGGLREAFERLARVGLRGFDMNPTRPVAGWDDASWMDYLRRHDEYWRTAVAGSLVAHPAPVPTPDSADDATVGEREVESGRWIGKAAEPNVEPSAQGDKAELVAILDAPLGWDYGARERANAVLRSDWLVQREEAAFRSGYEAGYKQRTEDAEYEEAEADDDTVGEREAGR